MAADREEALRALWECLSLSGADVSDYAHETRTEQGREAGLNEFMRRGDVAEVVEAVRELRQEYDAPDPVADAALRQVEYQRELCEENYRREHRLRHEMEDEIAQLRTVADAAREAQSLLPRLYDGMHLTGCPYVDVLLRIAHVLDAALKNPGSPPA